MAPDRVTVPVPALVKRPAPLITPDKVTSLDPLKEIVPAFLISKPRLPTLAVSYSTVEPLLMMASVTVEPATGAMPPSQFVLKDHKPPEAPLYVAATTDVTKLVHVVKEHRTGKPPLAEPA